MGYDYSKLRGRIVEKYCNVKAFADVLGVSRQSVDAMLHDKVGLTRDKMVIWAELIDIPAKDYLVYFFAKKVQ